MKILLAFLALSLLAPQASALAVDQTAAVLVPGEERAWDTDGPFTMGFRFRVEHPISITALGAFDHEGNGLAVPHTVALWSITGSPLFSATVPAGASTQLIDRFRYIPISPLGLTPGTQYIIAGSNFGRNSDPYLATTFVSQTSPRVTLFESRYSYTPTGSLAYPTTIEFYPTPGWFGANFRFTFVPEPSSAVLAMLAATSARMVRRKRR